MSMRWILSLGLAFVLAGFAHATEVGPPSTAREPLPEVVELDAASEKILESMNLTSPDVIHKVRLLLHYPQDMSSGDAIDLCGKLMTDPRPEAKRAAIDLVGVKRGDVTLFTMRLLRAAGDETEYFLRRVEERWDALMDKEISTLTHTLPYVVLTHKDESSIGEIAEELVARMIVHPGRKVAPNGISLAVRLGMDSEKIKAALEQQRDNEVYDHFRNEHPIRKAALEALGETYTPPLQEQSDFSAISIAEQMDFQKPEGVTIGILTSLYTAEGPCAGGGDQYGWGGQFSVLEYFGRRNPNVVAYFHPITKVDGFPVGEAARNAGSPAPVLNAASAADLALSDVVILPHIWNIRKEVISALEEYVWNGGGIVTIGAAGAITCDDSGQLAVLQDMRSINWSWSKQTGDSFVETAENPLTKALGDSMAVREPGWYFHKHAYHFSKRQHEGQVLLRFKKGGEAALRVGVYGKGRIAHFSWDPEWSDERYGARDQELLRRVVQWAAGQEYTDFRPGPAVSKRRYYLKRTPGTGVDSALAQLYEKAHFLEVAKGKPEEAAEIYKEVADTEVAPETRKLSQWSLARLSHIAHRHGNMEEALERFCQLVNERNGNPQVFEVEAFYWGVDRETKRYLLKSNQMFASMGLYFSDCDFAQLTEEDRERKIAQWRSRLDGSMSHGEQLAIECLGAVRCKEVVPELIEIAANQDIADNRTRWQAVRALGRIGDKRAVPELIHLVDYYNENTRYWARASLYRLTGQYFGTDKEAWAQWWDGQSGEPAYDPDREYPTLEEALDFFREIESGAPPRVTGSFPENGSNSVDPGVSEIRVTFSQRMRGGSWSWCRGERRYPDTTGRPHYLRDGKTCVLPVRLEPNQEYEIHINTERYRNFRSLGGVSAEPYVLTFRTGEETNEGGSEEPDVL